MNITEQSFLFKESLSKNNVQKEVHFIVKRTPFSVKLALSSDSPLTFTNTPLECFLQYDSDSKKEVEAPNTKPLEWVVRPTSSGRAATVEFRINVLTTQHQNNLFVILIRLAKSSHVLEVTTKPIKSVSKPEQVRRRVSLHQAEEPTSVAAQSAVIGACSSKKRARSEELLESLAIIQHKQQQQTEMLALLLANQTKVQMQTPFVTSFVPPCTPAPALPSFEVALQNLIDVYSQEAESTRPAKLRKVAQSLTPQKRTLLNDICQVMNEDTVMEDAPNLGLSWDSLLPHLGAESASCFEQIDAKKCEDMNNTFYQWLQN